MCENTMTKMKKRRKAGVTKREEYSKGYVQKEKETVRRAE